MHLELDPALFDAYFDRKPFYLSHRLADHPLFSLEELAKLATRLPPERLEWSDGQASEKSLDSATARSLPCDETIRQVERRQGVAVLRRVEHDPQYKQLLDEVLDEIQPLAEKVRPGMCRREGFIFISSRQTVTPFHFDPEHNFLLQIRGNKTVYMWDPQDRFVLPETAIESSYLEPENFLKPAYRESFLPSAWTLPLAPGQGLNFPLHAPHWVRTENEVGISFSVTFRSDESRRRQMIYAANGRLRRLGLPAPAVGRSLLWDRAAYYGYRVINGALSRLGRGSTVDRPTSKY